MQRHCLPSRNSGGGTECGFKARTRVDAVAWGALAPRARRAGRGAGGPSLGSQASACWAQGPRFREHFLLLPPNLSFTLSPAHGDKES